MAGDKTPSAAYDIPEAIVSKILLMRPTHPATVLIRDFEAKKAMLHALYCELFEQFPN